MLQLVLGRSGYGKTEYVFNSIRELVQNGEEALLITPEQYSFIAERRLLNDLGEMGVSKVQSTSFSRLNDEIKNVYGGYDKPILSKGAKAVMMKKAIEMVGDSLLLYGKNANQNSFVNSFIKIYDEMKSCRVTSDDIIEASQEVSKKVLADKLCDIATIMNAYDALISGKYLDPAGELARLYELLATKDYFVGKTVFVDGFSGFVAEEYKILEIILKQAKSVYITFCTDSFYNSDKFDLFYFVNRNIQILKSVAKSIDVEVSAPILLDKNYRQSSDLALVEINSYSSVKSTKNIQNDSVSIYSARSIYDECDHTACQIVELLRHGYKASDIAVICRDLDKYERNLEFSFEKYNVPYFDDERQSIASQPLIMLVNFLLRIVIYSTRTEDVISLLKTGLTDLSNEDISALENYAYVWSINGSKWFKPFVNSTKGFVEEITESDQEQIDKINISRQYVADKISKFKSSIKSKDCKSICKAIYFALIDFRCDEGLKNLAISLDSAGKSSLANEQGRIWDLLMQILDNLAVVGGDEKITIKEFYKLFNLMVSNEDLGVLPSGLDNIQIGSADRIRCDNPRCVFILGANEGEFPQAVASAGLLSENDRMALIKNDFKLYSYGEVLNAQEKFFAYMAMTSAKERLFVSYLSDSSQSSIVDELCSIFPNLEIQSSSDEIELSMLQSDENAFEALTANFDNNNELVSSLKKYFSENEQYSSRLNAVNRLVNNEEIKIQSTELATQLFNKNMYLSASKIEQYFNCSFRYFCKFGLNARPLQKAELDPMQSGIVIHYVLEQIIKENGKAYLLEMSHSQIVIEVNKHLRSYLETKMGNVDDLTPRFKYQFLRLSKMIVSVVERLCNEFACSDFEPRAFELKIGNGKNNEPVKSKIINLPDGGSIQINGSIDRVDTYTKNGVQYTRVVDYKSGTKKFKLSDILHGLNLQMFVYLFNLCESDNELAGINSGVLYLHSARSIANIERNANKNDVIKQEDKDFKMLGIVLNDDNHEIAEHMEHDLKGKYIPVKMSKKYGITGDIVTLAQLGEISAKIDSLVSQMGVDLHNGYITQNPILTPSHDKTCEMCDYRDVCKNRVEVNNRECDDLTNEQVFSLLEEGVQNA